MRFRSMFRNGAVIAIAVCILAALPTVAFALDPRKAITQYGHDVWQSDNGLPQNTVQAILQTSDGYIWLGTQEGLVRFDGVRFTIFDNGNTEAIKNNFIWTLFEDSQQNLWIGTSSGVVRYKNGNFSSFTVKDGLANDVVRAIVEDSQGTLWFGGGGLSTGKNGKIQPYKASGKLPENVIRAFTLGKDGSIWAGTSGGGLVRIRDGNVTTYTKKDGLPSDFIWPVYEDSRGQIWIGTDQGLAVFKDGKFTEFNDPALSSHFIDSIFEDKDHSLWIGTDHGLNRLRDGEIESYNAADGLSIGDVVSIYEDREGSLWVGTLGGGLNRFKEGKFTNYSKQEGLSYDFVRSIYEDSKGSIWISTWGGGLNQFVNGKFKAYTKKDGLKSDLVFPLLEDRHGALWIGTGGGLSRLQNGKITTLTTKDGLSNDLVRALYEDRAGVLWIGTDAGLNRYENGKFKSYTTKDGLSNDVVFAIHADSRDNLWVGTRAGLNLFKKNGFVNFANKNALINEYIKVIYEDGPDTLLIGTGTVGLARLQGDHLTIIGTKQGLFDDVVHQILTDSRGNLWMSSNKGIFYVSEKEIADFGSGKIRSVHSTSFGKSDGMRDKECDSGQPAGWRTRDGKLWFPTVKGVAVIDPEHITRNEMPPPVFIEQVIADGNLVTEQAGPVEVPPGRGTLEFHYTALSYLAPERVVMKYRLEGFDQAWINAGTRRTAYYTNIPPGHYTFKVMATNNDGLWTKNPAQFGLHLNPHFYQTYLFYTLCALSLVLVGVASGYRRVNRLRARESELALMEEAFESRAKAEEDLRLSEARYRSMVDSARYGIYRSSPECKYLSVNPAMVQMLGYDSADDLMQVSAATEVYADESQRDGVVDAFAKGGVLENVEAKWRRKDGKIITVLLSGRRVLDANGKTKYYEMIADNVTDRKALEEQLRQSQRMEAIGRLAGGIAHDFNNLLTVILGYSDVLLEQVQGLSLRNEVSEVKKAAKRAASLTRQLLAFSRQQVLAPRVLDLNTVVSEMDQMLRRLLGKDVDLLAALPEGVGRVKADRGQIEQVIMNLVVNARDAMPTGGKLTIVTANIDFDEANSDEDSPTKPGPYVVLAVSDTGTGMDADTLSRIFEPFFTTKELGKGTGLGLSTVYGIVKQSDGHVTVHSELGEGTTFKVFLPRVDEIADGPERDGQGPAARPLHETVLVVEDEEGVRSLVTHLLRRQGYQVLAAGTATDALYVCANHKQPIHLLLTDVVLGQMSGHELAQRIAPMLHHIKVLYMSGHTDEAIVERGILTPGTAFLQKPFTSESLAKKVREVLDSATPAAESTRV